MICQRCTRSATWVVTAGAAETTLCTRHKNLTPGGTHRPLAPMARRSWRKTIAPPDGIPH